MALPSNKALAACEESKYVSTLICHHKQRIKETGIAYSLQLISGNAIDTLGQRGEVSGLAAVDKTRTSLQKARRSQLSLLQNVELGVGNGLGNVILADAAIGNALQGLASLLSTLTDRGSVAGQLNGQQTSIRVSQVRGRDGETRGSSSGLGEEAEARGPLDGRLSTKKSSQDGNLRLGASSIGSRESNDHSIATRMASSLLTAVVLGSLSLKGLAALGGSRNILEELANPVGQGISGGTIGNNSDVGLGVDNVGVAGNVLFVQVLLDGRRGRGVDGSTEAVVEGNGMGVVEGESSNVGIEGGLLEVENSFDVFVELVGCIRC